MKMKKGKTGLAVSHRNGKHGHTNRKRSTGMEAGKGLMR